MVQMAITCKCGMFVSTSPLLTLDKLQKHPASSVICTQFTQQIFPMKRGLWTALRNSPLDQLSRRRITDAVCAAARIRGVLSLLLTSIVSIFCWPWCCLHCLRHACDAFIGASAKDRRASHGSRQLPDGLRGCCRAFSGLSRASMECACIAARCLPCKSSVKLSRRASRSVR